MYVYSENFICNPDNALSMFASYKNPTKYLSRTCQSGHVIEDVHVDVDGYVHVLARDCHGNLAIGHVLKESDDGTLYWGGGSYYLAFWPDELKACYEAWSKIKRYY